MEYLRQLTFDWAVRAFGSEHVMDERVRGIRFVEEAVELAQVLGASKEKLIKVIDVVYSRPPGEIQNEIGGVMMTLAVLCYRFNLDPDKCFRDELQRVLQLPEDHFTKRNQAKIKLGL